MFRASPRLVLSLLCLAILPGCLTINELPVRFLVTVPAPNTAGLSVELNKRYGLGLSGSFPIQNYGEVFLTGETPTANFKFGFNLHTNVFLKSSWVNYQEVSSLPTNASFPTWMAPPVVDIVIPEANTSKIDWHFYFGLRGQYYVGVAALIKQINEKFPALSVGYTFYNNAGHVVLGLMFFGPKLDSQGKTEVPGGIFIGTNLSPLLPAGFEGNDSMVTMNSMAAMELVDKVNRGQPVSINGQSVISDIQVMGPASGKYRSEKKIRGLVDKFMAASRAAN